MELGEIMKLKFTVLLVAILVNLLCIDRAELIDTRWVNFNSSEDLPTFMVFGDSISYEYIIASGETYVMEFSVDNKTIEINFKSEDIDITKALRESDTYTVSENYFFPVNSDKGMYFYEKDFTYSKGMNNDFFIGQWESMEIDNVEHFKFYDNGTYDYYDNNNKLVKGGYSYSDFVLRLEDHRVNDKSSHEIFNRLFINFNGKLIPVFKGIYDSEYNLINYSYNFPQGYHFFKLNIQ